MTLEKYFVWLEQFSGQLSRMKHHDEDDDFAKICEKSLDKLPEM